MHLSDETLIALRDTEISLTEKTNALAHLADCEACTNRLQLPRSRSAAVFSHLEAMTPPVSFRASTHPALEKFVTRRKESSMKSLFRRPLAVLAGVAILLVIALSFPNVQALAGSFLGLFRVQSVKIIQLDPNAMKRADGLMQNNSERLQAFFNQNMTVSHNGEYQKVDSAEQAAKIAGFTPRVPDGATFSGIGVTPAETADLTIDSTTMNTMLEALGRTDVRIPADLDGKKIHADIPSLITFQTGICPTLNDKRGASNDPQTFKGCMNLMEFKSPTIQAPDSFPIIQLAESMLQFLGMTPAQAKAYSQSIDWATTLVVPFPTTPYTTVQDVNVDGTSGTLVKTGTEGGQYTLIWVKDGIVYAFAGVGSTDQVLSLANALK